MADVVFKASLGLEFSTDTVSVTVPPGGVDDQYDPADGYQVVSWGFNDSNQDVRITRASIYDNRFSYVVQNQTTGDLYVNFFLLLLKVG
jgi:hypothetical protein